jgi:hypothetical protein
MMIKECLSTSEVFGPAGGGGCIFWKDEGLLEG